ncbi:epoxide hydrolase [Mycena leptocephala]|nr:epoxide hydrolase [Mycena leptocephala]
MFRECFALVRVPAATVTSRFPVTRKLHRPNSRIQELKTLLRLAKVAPPTYESLRPDAKFGVTTDWIQNAKKEWEAFDQPKSEAHINTFPKYKLLITDTDGTSFKIHFLALFSEKFDAFLEFLPIFAILSTRYTPATLPYHIVVPSLPVCAYSSPPPLDRDFKLQDVARLMTARILVSSMPTAKPPNVDTSTLGPPDCALIAPGDEFVRSGSSYSFQQATRPSTVSFVLASSSLALLACGLSLTMILESVSLYWFTETISNSFYPYRQTTVNHQASGFSAFPKEIIPTPRTSIEKTGTLVGVERPETLLRDVEDFVLQI